MTVTLRELTKNDEAAFFNGLNYWHGESLHWYTFSWSKGMPFEDMLLILENEKNGQNLKPDRVQHTMLYAFLGETIIGRMSVRHRLNDYLLQRGGHIGYSVAKPFRQKGFATEITRQGLQFCKSLNINPILVTCAETNLASIKIIEKFNGQLENKIWDETENETVLRYWIDLTE